jgi:hypothetical protein
MVIDPVELDACCIAAQTRHNGIWPEFAMAGARATLAASFPVRMPATKPREYVIQGVTLQGKTFRPSDWSERLAGAMSCFRPDSSGGIGAFIGYSPYCVPTVVAGVKSVIVNEALRDIEPMAWDFVMNFARDNDLQVGEVCVLPEAPST